MSRSLHKVSTLAYMHFALFDSADAAVTSAVDGDFSKLLYKDGATSAVTVTVTHIDSGVYSATFTPTSTGVWYLNVRHSTNAPRGFQHSFDVTTGGNLSTSDVADGFLDRTDGVETGVTPRQALQRIGATTAGELSVSGDGVTLSFKGLDDATVRVTATVDPETGARSVVGYA